MVGHPQGEGAVGLAQVPAEPGGGVEYEGQGPGPAGLHKGAGSGRDTGDQAVKLLRAGDEDRGRHLASTPLGVEQATNSLCVTCEAADAVDRVRRQHEQSSGTQVLRATGEGGGAESGVHIPHPPTTPAPRAAPTYRT